ncbi:MAG TPA: MFS transporter [Angustibacter sp.]|nr:MFS transporter [Angustibacter sp.]
MLLSRKHRTSRLPSAVRVLIAARAVNRLGAFSLPFLGLLLVRDLSADLVDVGRLLAAFGVASIASRLLGGWLCDRWSARATMVTGLVATAASQLAIAASTTIPRVTVGVLALGLAFEIYEPPSQALIADLTAPEQHAAAYGLLGGTLAAAGMAAGLIAAAVAPLGLRWLFVVDATSCLACALVVAAVLPRRQQPSRPAATDDETAAARARAWRDSRLLALLVVGTVFATVYLQVTVTLPLTLAERGLAPSSLGLLLTVSAATIALGQPALRRRSWSARPFVAMGAGYVLLAAGMGLNGVATTRPGFAAATVVWSVGDLLLLGHAYAVVVSIAPAYARGRYLSTYGLSWGLAAVLAPVAGTQLLAHLGPAGFWAVVAGVAASLALVQPALHRHLAPR